MISFFMRGVPPKTTFQSKKIRHGKGGKRYVGKSEEAIEATATLEAWLLPYQPVQPMSGPLTVRLRFTFPYRKGDSEKNRKQGIFHTVKPDIDNLCKGLIDCLASLRFVESDQEIVSLWADKTFGDDPGIYVEISEACL